MEGLSIYIIRGKMKVKNRVLYLSTLFLLILCISTKVEAKKDICTEGYGIQP